MKSFKSIQIKVALLALLVVGSFSCDNDFDEINTSPTQFTSIDPSFQFTWVLRRMTSERYETWRGNLIYSAQWAQQLAGAWGPDQYDVTNEDWASAQWNTTYRDYLRNTNDIISRTEEGSNQNLIARVLRVFFMQRLTDLYGDIPFSEAGQAVDNLTPVYDRQQDIYASFVSELTNASNNIDVSNGVDTFQEPIYDGDLTKWLKFTNSLLLKVGIRMSEVDATAAQSAITTALAGGVFDSTDDAAIATFADANSGGPRNGIGSVFQDFGTTGHQFSYSDEFVSRLQAQNDPRIPILMANYDESGNEIPTAPADFTGRVNGTGEAFTLDHAQPHRVNMVAYDSPRMMFSFAEVEFLRAEAIFRGFASGSAEDAYNSGVTAACRQLDAFTSNGVTDDQITTLLAETEVVYDGARALEQIITQKWLALVLNGYEAYAEQRRTGFPAVTPATNSLGGNGNIPGRSRYPALEVSANGANYQDALSRMGGNDDINASVWWDVN